ncbi:hypothetical protein [Faecalibacter bovis]|uniref:Uncharacterized protein n=1 Tax=Faecalibacter bovis TaxID=2898187 RepID=A0ABX7XD74_9FLAO|nr:hypothetical protein [Faecalibacter bovis]QTV05877.1 hypothetical protein J9309_00570 [Faecalibacter bovis]
MKKIFLIAAILFSQFSLASENKILTNEEKSLDINKIQKQKVVLNFTNSDDLKLTKSFKKDLVIYLNKKYKDYNFSFDTDKKSDLEISLNTNHLSVKHFNNPGSDHTIRDTMINGQNFFQSLPQTNINSYSLISFDSEIKIGSDLVKSSFLISKDGISKENKLLVNGAHIKEIDIDFLNFMKQDNFVNTQPVGLSNSGVNENTLTMNDRINDYNSRSLIFAILLAQLDKKMVDLQLI